METAKSFLSGIFCQKLTYDYDFDTGFIDPVCGIYLLNSEAKDALDADAEIKHKVTCALAQKKARSKGKTYAIRIIKSFEGFTIPKQDSYITETIETLVSQYPASAVQIIEESLYNLSCLINHPSDKIDIASDQHWLTYSSDGQGFNYVIKQLMASKYLDYIKPGTSQPPYTITLEGWKFLADREKNAVARSNQAFVGMWFNDDTKLIYESGLKRAIEESGYKSQRIDEKEHNNKICDEIISEIRKSKFMVADFTGTRTNVYFEAGFAYGLGIPVIWTMKESEANKLGESFDTRQYNHILYKDAADLRTKLKHRIEATIV